MVEEGWLGTMWGGGGGMTGERGQCGVVVEGWLGRGGTMWRWEDAQSERVLCFRTVNTSTQTITVPTYTLAKCGFKQLHVHSTGSKLVEHFSTQQVNLWGGEASVWERQTLT